MFMAVSFWGLVPVTPSLVLGVFPLVGGGARSWPSSLFTASSPPLYDMFPGMCWQYVDNIVLALKTLIFCFFLVFHTWFIFFQRMAFSSVPNQSSSLPAICLGMESCFTRIAARSPTYRVLPFPTLVSLLL